MSAVDAGDDFDFIYKDPVELIKWIDKMVEIITIDNKMITGRVLTIDPVSESIIISKIHEGRGAIQLVMGHAVKSIDLSSNDFDIPILSVPSFEDFRSERADEVRKQKLKRWLLANRIEVEEEGDVLLINETLSIHAPYGVENCFSSNSIALERIRNLISMLPH